MENMFLEKDGNNVCLIDWQTVRYGGKLSIAHELVQFFARNVDVEFLNANDIDEFLQYYLQELGNSIKGGESGISFEELKGLFLKSSNIAITYIILLGSRLPFPKQVLPPGNESAQLKLNRHYAVFDRSVSLMNYFLQ